MTTKTKVVWTVCGLLVAVFSMHKGCQPDLPATSPALLGVAAERIDTNAYRFGPEKIVAGIRTITLIRDDGTEFAAIVSPPNLDLHQVGIREHLRIVWVRYQIGRTNWAVFPVLCPKK